MNTDKFYILVHHIYQCHHIPYILYQQTKYTNYQQIPKVLPLK